MIGLTASLDKRDYEKRSNRESGEGRYDIMIIPKDLHKLAIILELKSVKLPKDERNTEKVLKQEAQEALAQIERNQYSAELQQRGHKHVLNIGLAFSGKRFYVEAKQKSLCIENGSTLNP